MGHCGPGFLPGADMLMNNRTPTLQDPTDWRGISHAKKKKKKIKYNKLYIFEEIYINNYGKNMGESGKTSF